MNVICTNEECEEFEVLKDAGPFRADEISCGKCGQPVEEVAEDG